MKRKTSAENQSVQQPQPEPARVWGELLAEHRHPGAFGEMRNPAQTTGLAALAGRDLYRPLS